MEVDINDESDIIIESVIPGNKTERIINYPISETTLDDTNMLKNTHITAYLQLWQKNYNNIFGLSDPSYFQNNQFNFDQKKSIIL